MSKISDSHYSSNASMETSELNTEEMFGNVSPSSTFSEVLLRDDNNNDYDSDIEIVHEVLNLAVVWIIFNIF